MQNKKLGRSKNQRKIC